MEEPTERAMRTDIRPFLVTGSGRCGTGYTAHLLEALGYRCGHESVFGIETALGAPWQEEFARVRGDSSWLAAPLIPELPSDTIVFHQVRNPVSVVRSLQGIRFLSADARRTSPYSRFAATALDLPEDELEANLRFWSKWNELIEFCCADAELLHAQYRVEDLDQATVREMVALIEPDRELGDEELQAAFDEVPSAYNARTRDEAVTWESIVAGGDREAIRAQAERYGYTEQELASA